MPKTASNQSRFADAQLRTAQLPTNFPFESIGLALGKGASALEVLVVQSPSEPRLPTVRSAWKSRSGGRAAPLVLVVRHGDKATLCGPAGEDPPAYPGLDLGQAERICREALEQPDRHAALRCLRDALPSVDSELPGIRNEGFLATHELARGIRRGARWEQHWSNAASRATPLLPERGESLLRGLGFQIERVDQVTSVLRAGTSGRKTAVAVLLNQNESPELQADRFSGLSPISYALAVADRENVPYVIVSQGSKLRLYPVKVGVGVGRRGRTETYVEINTGLIRDSDAPFLWLLFSSEALIEGGTLETIVDESKRFAGDLAEKLRDRIYGEVVPRLAQGIAEARGLRKPSAMDLAETYEMAMTVLFRLLFIAYAEDKDLLPYRWNGLYRARSLKTKAQELLELVRSNTEFEDGDSHWQEIQRLFRAVEKSNREWSVPEYDGGLFISDPDISKVGGLLAEISLPNHVFGEVLKGLLLIQSPDGWGPVDFRSLGVREFGTIYEGLLESELSVAETDLTYDETGRNKGLYRPCRSGEEPKVEKRRIYLHDKSGARKSTGSYFTKEFAVEHLLDQALEPALADHLSRLDKLDDEAAGKAFFDFRVADIAMGSGHFLVAAVDRIERAFTQYLSKRPLADVRGELATLRAAALNALGPLADTIGDEIEDTQLLRRLIARRCIYGVDLNPVSVNLARLSIWIHTFVPGLPLSLLDRNLVVGNSLVGIGTLNEIEEYANRDSKAVSKHKDIKDQARFDEWLSPKALLGDSLEPLRRLANIADATVSEVGKARRAMAEAREKTRPAEALCNIVTACRMNDTKLPIDLGRWDEFKDRIVESRDHKAALKAMGSLTPFHFPITFPEVFLRERSGFDVILGNPPWEKARVEEHEFWSRNFPGLRAFDKADRDKAVTKFGRQRPDLVAVWESERDESEKLRNAVRHLPGMDTGHPDLFRAFLWRFLQLVRADGGHIAVVLPGDAFKIAGAAELRARLAEACSAAHIQMLTNNGGWVFDDVHQQKLIALVCCVAGSKTIQYTLPPEFHSSVTWALRDPADAVPLSLAKLQDFSATLIVPLISKTSSWEIVELLMRSPRLLGHPFIRVRRVYADFETSKHDKQYWHSDREESDLPVYKGESFDLWTPDTQKYFAFTNSEKILEVAHVKRQRAPKGSPYSETSERWRQLIESHPIKYPRIAFRDVTNRTNQRTLVVALIPPRVVTVQTSPWILWLDESHKRWLEAYLLGVMSSLPLDWWCRRFIEGHADQEAINCLRIPDPNRSTLSSAIRVAGLACQLAAVDNRYSKWVEAVQAELIELGAKDGAREIAYGRLDGRKFEMICELDAVATHLYGLSEAHLTHIFETFHEGWEPGTTASHPTLGAYNERLETTIEHYRRHIPNGGQRG